MEDKGITCKGKGYKVEDGEGQTIEFGTYIPAGVVDALENEEENKGGENEIKK